MGGEELRRPQLPPTYDKTISVDLPPPMSLGQKLDQLMVGGLLFFTPSPVWTGVVIADAGTAFSEGEGISPVVSAVATAEGMTALAKVGGNLLSKSGGLLAGEATVVTGVISASKAPALLSPESLALGRQNAASLAKQLRNTPGTTTQALMIADALENETIGVNILGEQMFKTAFNRYGGGGHSRLPLLIIIRFTFGPLRPTT